MSIDMIGAVWNHSSQKGGTLLVLLALADYSNDDGVSWPSIVHLAHKARLSERQVQRVLESLVTGGELEIQANAGPNGVHLYRVLVSRDKMSPHFSRFAPRRPRLIPNSPTAPTPALTTAASRHISGDEMSPPPLAQARGGDILEDIQHKSYAQMSPESVIESVIESVNKNLDSARPSDLAPGPSRDQTVYVQALAVLQGRLPKQEFVTWVQPTEVAEQSVKDGTLNVVLAANNPLHASALRRHLPAIEKAMTEVAHKSVTLWVKE